MLRVMTHLAKDLASSKSPSSGCVWDDAAISVQALCSGDLLKTSMAAMETFPLQEKVPRIFDVLRLLFSELLLFGQLYQNFSFLVFFARCLDGTSMVFYDLFGDREPQACSDIFC